ncbi:MAG: type II toxin-antitoxin system HicB family antitoxin [Lachnospiraceae bacterium]|nr:type II toxin-antitoxin system HicB family antitoxin [Lachnospiraceae bacterium]
MNNTICYKGYVGSVEFSEEDGVFFGKVMGIRALISYEGQTAKDLVDDFHYAVDDYFELCKAEGQTPEKAYKGSFNVRISPELHRNIAIYAAAHEISLNSFVEKAISHELALQKG